MTSTQTHARAGRGERAPATGAARRAPADRLRGLPPALVVGALCALVALLADLLIIHERGLGGDEPYYERMAVHTGGPHNFPYAYRVGLPWLVHVLPFSHTFSFGLLALLAAAAAGGVLFVLLREFDIGAALATGLAVGFAVSPPLLVVLLRNGRSVDPAAILILMLGTLFIVRRRKLALALTLLVGITVHESDLFLIPLAYAVWAERWFDRRAAGDVITVAALPIAVYLVLRISIDAVGESRQPGYSGPFLQARIDVIRQGLDGGWQQIRRVASAFGPLWCFAPLALSGLRFARRGLVLVALCVFSMSYALDWGRMIFFAAPVIYVAAAYVIRRRRALALATVVTLLALDVGYAIYMQVHGVRHGLDSTAPPARGPVY